MPSFTFKGFAPGSQVALSAAQGAASDSGAVPTWGQGSLSASLDILKIEAVTVPAPAFVWFEAINLAGFDVLGGPGPGQVYDPSFDGVTFVWTVEGSPLAPYGVPNLVQGWDNANIAYGKKVAFFFPDPDTTYTIRCWAIDQSGNRGEATTTFATGNADAIYGGSATICLDPSGSFAGAPAGAQQVTTVAAMQSAVNLSNGPRRILIARGQEIANFEIDEFDGGNTRYIGTFGTGLRPILRHALSGFMFDFYRTTAPQLTLEGLDCRGWWDAATETGRPSDLIRPYRSSLQNLTVWDCRFDGFSMFNPTLSDTGTYLAGFGNTEITNWNDYGLFAASSPNSKYAIVGCDIAQNLNAINHSQTERNGMVNQQGPLRLSSYDGLYVGASSFLSRAGWSGGNDQPCLRLNSDTVEGAETVVDRVTCEGGSVISSMSGANSGRVEKPGNYLWDKVLILAGGGKTGREMIFANFGGSTFRNMLFAMLDVPNANSVSFNNCLDLTPDQSDWENLTAPIKVYNCASINMRGPANDLGDSPALTGSSAFSNYTYENNLVHAPSLDTPQPANQVSTTTTMPGASGGSFQPRYYGIRPNFPFETGTLGGNVGNGGSFTLSYPSGTNQAYWQAIQSTDTRHMLKMGDTNYYAAYDGGFSVAYEGAQVRITNTSGSTWSAGISWTLRLDRKSELPAMDTTYGNPASLPMPEPLAGTPVANGDAGFRAYDDFLGRVRPGPGGFDHLNKTRPASGNAQGPILTP